MPLLIAGIRAATAVLTSGLQARRAQGTSATKKSRRTPSPQGAGNVRGKKEQNGLQARRAQGTSATKKSRRTPSPQGAGNVRDKKEQNGLQARRAQGTSAAKKSRTGHSGESRARHERRPRRRRNVNRFCREAQNGHKMSIFKAVDIGRNFPI